MPETTVRIEQIQSAMEAAGIDAVVLRMAENVVLATDWYVQISGLGLVVIGRSGGATLLVPEYEAEEAAAVWPGDIRTFPRNPERRPLARRGDHAAPRRSRPRARRNRRRDRLRGELRVGGAGLDVRGAERRRSADAGADQDDLRDHTARRLQRGARVAARGQDRPRHRAPAPHERDRRVRPGRVQRGRPSRRDRDRGAGGGRARDHGAGPWLQGRPLGSRLLHDLLGPGSRPRVGSTGAHAPGRSSRATSSCSSSERSRTATGRDHTRYCRAPASRHRD